MSGIEKIILPKKKEKGRGVKGIINYFLSVTDYTIPYAYVDQEFRFIDYLDIIVEFDDIDKLFVDEELFRKAFEPVNYDETLWRPRILNYNFYAVDDVNRFFKALYIMKKIFSMYDLRIKKVHFKRGVASAMMFNYLIWRVNAGPFSIEEVEGKTEHDEIVTSKWLFRVWKHLDEKHPNFIILPADFDEHGDNTVYGEEFDEFKVFKFIIFWRESTLSGGFHVYSIVMKNKNPVLFNSNYGMIVYYALTKQFVKLQEYILTDKMYVIKPVYPEKKGLLIRAFSKDTIDSLADSMIESGVDFESAERVRESESAVMVSDKIFNTGNFVAPLDFQFEGNADSIIANPESSFKDEMFAPEDEGDDWYSSFIKKLDKGLDWGITSLFTKDLEDDTEYYAPTRDEYLEDFIGVLSDEDIEELRKEGYDI